MIYVARLAFLGFVLFVAFMVYNEAGPWTAGAIVVFHLAFGGMNVKVDEIIEIVKQKGMRA